MRTVTAFYGLLRLIKLELFYTRKEMHIFGLRYQGTPNDNIAFSPFERQAFHKDPNKLYIF